MELKIIDQRQNHLFSRTEIKAELLYEGKTPQIPEVRKALASQLKKEEAVVIIKNIFQKFGINKAIVEARVYSKKEDLEKAEPKYIINRQTGKKAEKAEKAAEKPAEEAKK